ncbi:MAG: hypothetical protein IJ458_03890 [Clostridia bacterium]|nr:hypothetical protein [Clostridia bacterium]
MNSRIIKTYVEMKTSQNQNTPLIENKNPKALSQKAKRCLGNPKPSKTEIVLQK